MEAIEIDEGHAPIFSVTVLRTPTAADFARYLAWQERNFARQQRHVIIFELRPGASLELAERLAGSDFTRKHSTVITAQTAGFCFVFPNVAMRFIVSSALAFGPALFPYAVFAVREDAIEWAEEQLALLSR
ncbi:MAG: hypothetical protein Q8O67_21745 [Deltaproteobacteria bacterium]|nr:hypothetical protein [Deltaproteobacteria bacterium]